jgi:DNA-binding transcriptional MerR regulator
MEDTWTIGELAELASAALADEPARGNGRVRELPNERLIRWYTTIGLLDPPAARRGRNALYGPRHLLQLVAVKRRQAAGLAIADIQVELAGATDAALREIARLPEEIAPGAATTATTATSAADAPARRARPHARFWAAAPPPPGRQSGPGAAAGHPAPSVPPAPAAVLATPAQRAAAPSGPAEPGSPAGIEAPAAATTEPAARAPRAAWPPEAPAVVPGVRLAAGVALLLDGAPRPLDAADLAAIQAAARPLLDEVRRRGLGPEPHPAQTSGSTEPAPPQSPGRHST